MPIELFLNSEHSYVSQNQSMTYLSMTPIALANVQGGLTATTLTHRLSNASFISFCIIEDRAMDIIFSHSYKRFSTYENTYIVSNKILTAEFDSPIVEYTNYQ